MQYTVDIFNAYFLKIVLQMGRATRQINTSETNLEALVALFCLFVVADFMACPPGTSATTVRIFVHSLLQYNQFN